jgi:hypothetical protein
VVDNIPENDVVLEGEEVQVAVYAHQLPVLEHGLSENVFLRNFKKFIFFILKSAF